MKKRIVALMISFMLALGIIFTLASCGGGETPTAECAEHKDENGDGICDTEGCGKTVEPTPGPSGEHFNENGPSDLF